MAELTEYFRETWSMPSEDVVEAEEGSIFIWSHKLQKKNKKTKKNKRIAMSFLRPVTTAEWFCSHSQRYRQYQHPILKPRFQSQVIDRGQ
jgi:hypothetical protein